MLPTNNIFDQKYCRIITRTSPCNSRNSFRETFFQSKINYQRHSWSKVNFKSILERLWFLQTTLISDQTHCRIITRTSLCNSRNSFRNFFPDNKGYSSWFKVNLKSILKRSYLLQTTFLITNTVES